MTGRLVAVGIAAWCVTLGSAAAGAALRCVGSGPGCFRSLQAAVDAAHDGDVIAVGPGSFAGGVTITKSLTVTGAGANANVIRGGGPVLTIGTAGQTTRPVVAISGVKVTGGRTTVNPDVDFVAFGGGIWGPGGADGPPGGTGSVDDSVTPGNVAAPAGQLNPPPGSDGPVCPSGPCPFAGAFGGGIANFGALTLTNTLVK